MRTMFISFVLIWSLAQLASATATLPTKRDELYDCGLVYDCFAPLSCIQDVNEHHQPINFGTSRVVKVAFNALIFADCPGFIGFHLTSQHKAHVIIGGLLATTESIVYTRKGKSDLTIDAKFSCERTSDPVGLTGKYSIKVDDANPKADTQPMQYDESSKIIKCKMYVNLVKQKYAIFKPVDSSTDRDGDLIQFTIKSSADSNPKSTKAMKGDIPTEQRCDPDLLKYNNIEMSNIKKKYEKVHYEFPQKYSCQDDRFKMEFLKESANTYTEITKLLCDYDNLFHVTLLDPNEPVNPVIVNADDDVNIRCVADLLLFCDVSPNVIGTNGPTYEAPTRDKFSKLYCPPDAPHLVVEGIDKPIQNPIFTCLVYGNDQFWTVKGHTGEDIMLTATRAVFCTKDLECHLYLRIEENAVKSGDLDEQTYVPKCYFKGVLNVIDGGGKPKPIETPYCDKKEGKYKYREEKGGTEHKIDKDTKFECTYPQETNEAIDKKDTALAIGGGVAGIIGAIIGGIAIVAIITFIGTRRQKKAMAIQKEKERQYMAYGQKQWLRYCANSDEIDDYNDNHPKQDEKSAKEVEMNIWNKMLMIFQLKALEHTGPNVTVPNHQIVRRKDTPRLSEKIVADNDTGLCTDFMNWGDRMKKAGTRVGIEKFNEICKNGNFEATEDDDELAKYLKNERELLRLAKQPGSNDKNKRRDLTREMK